MADVQASFSGVWLSSPDVSIPSVAALILLLVHITSHVVSIPAIGPR